MRFLELRLDAFGPFTQVALDLAAGHEGLHLICGPNEAGKTSTLRAIRQLLYGIAPQTSDAFLHDYKNLRLGATLGRANGERLEFVRLKRSKNALLEADGVTPMDQSRLERFLGGVDQSLFTNLFGIDHETLVRGGREIVAGGGSLANVLFSATSGISSLRGLQQQLQAQADELFKPLGRTQKIPRTIAEFRQAGSEIRDSQLPSEKWERHEQALRAARAEQAALQAQAKEKQCEHSRLSRIRAAFSLFAERTQLLSELEGFLDAVNLPPDFTNRRQKAQAARDAAEREINRARGVLTELKVRLQAIDLPRELLAAEREIDALKDSRAAFRKAQEDRLKRERDLQEKQHAGRDVLQSLGKERNLACAESLRLRVDEPGQIDQLSHRFTELSTRRREATNAIRTHGDRLRKLQQEIDSLGIAPNIGPLRTALDQALGEGQLEEQHARIASQLAPLERELSRSLRRLPGWNSPVEILEQLTLPLPETVSRHEEELREAGIVIRELEDSTSKLEQTLLDTSAKLRGQSLQHEVPSEEDLRAARHRRDAGWSAVRSTWLEGADLGRTSLDLNGVPAAPVSLAHAFERWVAEADVLADRLRREAQSVTDKAAWLAQLQRDQESLRKFQQDRERAIERESRLRSEWEGILSAAGLPPMSPSELRGWSGHCEKILAQNQKVRELQDERNRIEERIRDHLERLRTAMLEIEKEPLHLSTFAAAITTAQALIERHEKTAKSILKLDSQLVAEKSLLDAKSFELSQTEADLEDWESRWGPIMERIGLRPDATPEQARLVLSEIDKLFKLIREADGFQSRIKGIDRDAEQFAEDASALASRVAPELMNRPPAEIADTLSDRLRVALDDQRTWNSITERIQNESESLDQTERAMGDCVIELQGFCRDAGCDTEAELPRAEERSARKLQLQSDIQRCEQLIRQQSGGVAVEAFGAEVSACNPDELDGALSDLSEALERIQQRLAEVNQIIGAEQRELELMDGSSKAAEANETAGFALAQLQEDVQRYVVLRMSSRVLQQGIDRYRERNQGPVLSRAGELFAALTLGSFANLIAQPGDRGEVVIEGVRPDGSTLGVEGMSTGSCDQLYLAFRIAYLEHWLTGREPIPFIVDDILLQFDDARATAALRVLGELSRRTQVIFLTHHTHLLDLAKSCLPVDVCFPRMISRAESA